MEYYSTIKKNEIMPIAATWMQLEIIILSEVSQTVNNKYHMISPTLVIFSFLLPQLSRPRRDRFPFPCKYLFLSQALCPGTWVSTVEESSVLGHPIYSANHLTTKPSLETIILEKRTHFYCPTPPSCFGMIILKIGLRDGRP